MMEKWYSIRYNSNKYSHGLMDHLCLPTLKKNGKILDLPLPNTLLPKNFDLVSEVVKEMELI